MIICVGFWGFGVLDSEADMDEEKPGGIFTKNLYADEALGTESSVDKDSEDEAFGDESGKNGGIDAKFSGFCRTGAVYRAHYKIARMKQAKMQEV
jgi:hypothetical protein